ncbi:MAG: hypothetical protein WD826_07825, partial [Actinomycetota bacterium]
MTLDRRKVLTLLVACTAGLVGAWLAMALAASETTTMGGFTVETQARFGRGETVVALPPLGEV